MALSIHQTAIPTFQQMLTSLSAILDKAAAHCQAKGIDPAELVNARLAPDMFPLFPASADRHRPRQGRDGAALGAGTAEVRDTEQTFDELKARIAKTLAFVQSASAGEFDGSDEKDVTITVAGQPRTLKGHRYLFGNALPNFFFHVTTAYDILRHKGVDVGKRDYMGTY